MVGIWDPKGSGVTQPNVTDMETKRSCLVMANEDKNALTWNRWHWALVFEWYDWLGHGVSAKCMSWMTERRGKGWENKNISYQLLIQTLLLFGLLSRLSDFVMQVFDLWQLPGGLRLSKSLHNWLLHEGTQCSQSYNQGCTINHKKKKKKRNMAQ